jgi:hypothetical protein
MMMKLDSLNNVYWIEECATSARRGGVVRAYVPSGNAALAWGAATSIAAGSVGTVIGSTGLATNSCTISIQGIAQNSIILQSPMDLLVTSDGMYITEYNQDHIYYVNKNAANDTANFGSWLNGATGAPARTGIRFAGNTAGQNSSVDGSPANSTNLGNPYGITASGDGTKIYWSDNYFGYVRYNTPASTGVVDNVVGSGFLRTGPFYYGNQAVTATDAQAPSAYLQRPTGIVIDNTARKMYISEMFYRRITVVDLATGEFSHYAGSQTAGLYNDDLDKSALSMVYPLGITHTDVLKQYTYNSPLSQPSVGNHLIYSDSSTTTGNNQPCMLRSIYQSGGSNLFGLGSFAANTVRTLIGKLNPGANDGCTNPATAVTNTDFTSASGLNIPMTAVTATGSYLRSIALGVDTSSNPVLFVALSEKNCILKVSSTGSVTPVIGNCNGTTGDLGGIATTVDTTSNFFNAIKGIAIDPLNPTNLFVIDQANQTSSKIKYVNLGSSTVNTGIFGNTVLANKVLTIHAIANTPYFNSLAINSTKLCYSAGYNAGNGTGESHVACYTRSTGSADFICGGDTTLYSNRDGAPLTSTSGLLEADGVTESYGYQEGKSCASNTANNKGWILMAGPSSVQFDSSGNLYIADTLNHVVRMIKGGW